MDEKREEVHDVEDPWQRMDEIIGPASLGHERDEEGDLEELTPEEEVRLEFRRYRAALARHFVSSLPAMIQNVFADIDIHHSGFFLSRMRREWSSHPNHTRSAVLAGRPGNGKSVAASWAVWRQVLIYSQPGCFIHVPTYASHVMLGRDSPRTWDRVISVEQACEEDGRIVVVDELGRERNTEALRERVSHLLEALHLRQARLVLTTNLTLDQIAERYGGHILSRLLEERWMTWVYSEAPDARMAS